MNLPKKCPGCMSPQNQKIKINIHQIIIIFFFQPFSFFFCIVTFISLQLSIFPIQIHFIVIQKVTCYTLISLIGIFIYLTFTQFYYKFRNDIAIA